MQGDASQSLSMTMTHMTDAVDSDKLKSAKIFSLTNVIILPVIIIRLILKVGLSL